MRSPSAPTRSLRYGSTMSAEPQGGGRGAPAGIPTSLADAPRCLLTFSANVISSTGPEPSAEFAAAAAALARDAQRAARHLGFGPWEGVVAESAEGVLGFAPAGPDSDRLAAVVLPVDTPLGAAQRIAASHAAEGADA